MKKFFVTILLAFLLILSGCGGDDGIYGRVTAMDPESKTFTILTEYGKEKSFQFDDETAIASWIDGADREDFLNGHTDGLYVTVRKEWSRVTMISLDALRTSGAVTLADGTAVDTVESSSFTSYWLGDGTALLTVSHPIGPENVSVVGVSGLDALPQQARENIVAYYAEKGLMYDVQEELERAYSHYMAVGSEQFEAGYINQDITPVAASEKVIYFFTECLIPSNGAWAYDTQYRLCEAFDRQTGEKIPMSALFTCSWEEAVSTILDISGVPDEDRPWFEKVIQPENIIIFSDCLEVFIPRDAEGGESTSTGIICDFNGELTAILHDWAIPNQEN